MSNLYGILLGSTHFTVQAYLLLSVSIEFGLFVNSISQVSDVSQEDC